MELHSLAGHERFELKSKLGQGGFGEVYEVFDRERGAVVALKILRNLQAGSLRGFKKEFRTLAGLSHPNLVQFYELHVDEHSSFFTMERVEGTSVLDFVRERTTMSLNSAAALEPTARSLQPLSDTGSLQNGESAPADSPSGLVAEAMLQQPVEGEPVTAKNVFAPYNGPKDYEAIREVLRQIAEALTFLHERGKLHRDLKPSNILVDRSGRIVLLDFGLAAELAATGKYQADALEGTPAYMAPEAARREALPGSDWYSVGVILYESLTGAVPFDGDQMLMLAKKQVETAPSPKSLVDRTPEDLDRLCMDLLAFEPSKRPTGREVLERLARTPVTKRTSSGSNLFVGRESHLKALTEAFELTKGNQLGVALLRGPSAMGKSTLIQRALEEFRSDPDTLVLEGRCHPHESVPYKAVDALIDALSQHLRWLPERVVASLVPKDAAILLRVFPVLQDVKRFWKAPTVTEAADPTELRRRAFAALRMLLQKIAQRSRVVMFIDDLQWGDLDSASLLAEVLRAPSAPGLLFVASYRSDEEQTSPCLKQLLPALRAAVPPAAWREIEVGPLAFEEAQALARAVLVSSPNLEAADRIAREAKGQPMFVSELARSAHESPQDLGTHARVSLDDLIRSRAAQLQPLPARLIQIVATAGRPLPQRVVERVAGEESGAFAAWHQLLAGRWLRSRQSERGELVEPYHDRIREALVEHSSPEEKRALHAQLGQLLETMGGEDLESLAFHFQAARNVAKTARYAFEAAQLATTALAFDRAARLYRVALDATAAEDPQRRLLERGLGDALALDGRRGEAADAYLRAVSSAEPEEALDLQRCAAQQLIATGQIEKGVDIIRSVLARVGIAYPESIFRAILQLLSYAIRLGLSRWRFRPRPSGPRLRQDRLRLDSLHVATHFLGLVDPLRGMSFSKAQAFHALQVDDPMRASRALASEISYHAIRGGDQPSTRETALYRQARALAETSKDPLATGFVELCAGIGAELRGRWAAALDHLNQADTLFRPRQGTIWEMDVIHFFRLYVSRFRGEWAAAAQYLADPLVDARLRGDVYAETQLVTIAGDLGFLLADDLDSAWREQQVAIDRWGRKGLDQQRVQSLFAFWGLQLCRDAGRGGAAWEMIETHQRALSRSGALVVAPNFISFHELRARAALAQAAGLGRGKRSMWLRRVEADAQALSSRKVRWASALATGLRACAQMLSDKPQGAAARMEEAEAQLSAVNMKLHAAGLRWRRGELVDSAELRAQGRAVFAGEGACNPERLSVLFSPPGG
jgi:serine/threonine protein kinase